MPDHDHRLTRKAGGLEEAPPVKSRRFGGKILKPPRVVCFMYILRVCAARVRVRYFTLEVINASGRSFRVGYVGELQDRRYVGAIFGLQLYIFSFCAQVIITVRQA